MKCNVSEFFEVYAMVTVIDCTGVTVISVRHQTEFSMDFWFNVSMRVLTMNDWYAEESHLNVKY